MATYTRLVAAASILSAVSASPFDNKYAFDYKYPSCKPTTTTVYETITVSADNSATSVGANANTALAPSVDANANTPPATLSASDVSFPTYSAGNGNPNGIYYNPYDYVPEVVTWPGKPTKGQFSPPPRPTPKWNYGGHASALYHPPAWVPKGSDLTPALPQSDTNGNSPWGTLQCPHLPPYLGPGHGGGHVQPSLSSSSEGSVETSSSYYSLPGKSTEASSSSVSASTGPSGVASSSGSSPSVSSSFSLGPTGSSSVSAFPTLSSSVGPFGNSTTSGNTTTTNGTLAICGSMPDTGVTRQYTFDVSYQKIAPDGVVKNGLVVNGGFPGPLIEANWGDWIEVTVTNSLTDEGTSLHWHGLLQNGTPFYDGVPSVSQSPIAPGETFVYRFRADQPGTSWWHSHYSAQYNGGASGPLVIHGPKFAEYDEDLGPIMLSDWYHKDYFTIVNETLAGVIPLSDNNLINGKANYPCANATDYQCTPNAGISKFQFKSGKKYRLRLINTSSEGMQKFTIDGHTFTVIANDFIPINPYTTTVITLGVGQRSDVIVEAVGSAGDSYWMRSNLGTPQKGCSFTTTVAPEALAAIYYENADTNSVPSTSSSLTDAELTDCGNDPLSETTPLCVTDLSKAVPATTETIDIVFGSNGTSFIYFMNNQTFRGDYNDPVLEHVQAGNMTFTPETNVYNFGTNSSVRIILKNYFTFGPHPMHLHGHNFHVMAEGFGDWDGTVVNAQNPQARDVQIMRPAQTSGNSTVPSFIVLQWRNDNAGVWPLHCHIAWHVSAGLYVNILERPADIQALTFPDSIAEVAASWDAWTSKDVVDQIDSGL